MNRTWRRLLLLVVVIGMILLIPLIVMKFTDEVDWGSGDFIITAILLFATGIVIELFNRKIRNRTYGGTLIVFVILCLLLLWAELAVGIFGSPIAGD